MLRSPIETPESVSGEVPAPSPRSVMRLSTPAPLSDGPKSAKATLKAPSLLGVASENSIGTVPPASASSIRLFTERTLTIAGL